MQIKSIQLSNFRRYKGTQDPIVFSTDPDKNVTIILGANTSGKTTIVQAFLWCLYGKSTFKTKEVINADVEYEIMRHQYRDVFVEIILIHTNQEFTIRRTQRFTLNNKGEPKGEDSILKIQYKESNGEQQAIPLRECKDTINKILPEALSDYFFFDGERIADINNRGDVAAAVRGLMGLDVLGEARNRLDPSRSASITSKMKNELDLGTDKKDASLKQQFRDKQNEREKLIERLNKVKEEIDFYTCRKDELKDELAHNEHAKELQFKRAKLEKDISIFQDHVRQTAQQILSDFRKSALDFFTLPLIDRAIEAINNSKQDGVGIPEMRQTAIDHILERGRCICGCDLQENQGARKRILFERNLLPPEHIGTSLRNYKLLLNQYQQNSDSYVDTVKENYVRWRQSINNLDEKKIDLKNLSVEINALGSIDVIKIEADYQKNENALSESKQRSDRLVSAKGGIERDIENIEKNIAALVTASAKNIKIQKRILYADALFNLFNKNYLEKEAEIKDNLLESVNRIFAEMYHGQRIVTIDDKYRITLLAQVAAHQRNIDESRGLEAVKNFSFIAGLVDIARKKMNKNNTYNNLDEKLDIETEAYPLVMDAPFSNADEIHINNISRIIPEIAEQIILIVMQKDWEYAKTALEGKVGKSYIIEKTEKSETCSMIREA